ncbi:MAG: hypothetical protein FD123_2373 [Bacteroidetes bacterium]|nr:MAG: hypothetical protein FD123_2373 [Bacteroidota bacterium]
MTIRKFILPFVLFLPLLAQAAGDSIAYGSGFRFRDGIFLRYEQFRSNSPVPKKSIISSYDTTRLDFVKTMLSYNSVHYRDTANLEQSVGSDKVWGYAENGAAYIYVNGQFNRITVVGSLCHFTAMETHYMYTGSPTPYGSPYGTPVQQLVQLILDTQTGNVLQFTPEVMEKLLERDDALYKEFTALKKKKKKQSIFIYLRKYNEKHPLKFPA